MDQSTTQQLVAFYRSWQTFEQRISLEAAYWVVVDDLCTTSTEVREFKSRDEIAATAKTLLAHVTKNASGPYATYTQAKLEQSLLHLSVPSGETLTRKEIEARGMPWSVPSDAELAEMKSDATRLRKRAEAALTSRGVDSKAYFTTSLAAKEAAACLQQEGVYWLRKFQEIFGVDTSKASFRVEAKALAASFHNLLVTDGDDLVLLLNTNAGPVFSTAHLRFLALHEVVGHVLHFCRLKANAVLQREAPHLLCIAIHTVDALHVEGIAQALSMALLAETDGAYPEIDAQMAAANLFMAVRHRNICGLLTGSISVAEAAAHHAAFLGGQMAHHATMYKARIIDPFACAQGLAYYASLKLYAPFLKLSPQDFALQLDNLLVGFFKQKVS